MTVEKRNAIVDACKWHVITQLIYCCTVEDVVQALAVAKHRIQTRDLDIDWGDQPDPRL